MKEFDYFKIWYRILGIFSSIMLFIGIFLEAFYYTSASAILIILSISILESLTVNTIIYFQEKKGDKKNEEE